MSVNSERHQACTRGPRCFGSFEFGIERSEPELLFVDPNTCSPFALLFSEVNSTVGGCLSPTADVLDVASGGDDSQIGTAAIQPVAIYVVNNYAISKLQPQQCPMKLDTPLTPNSIGNVSPRITAVEIPPPLVDPVGISGINDGVGSDAAVSGAERNTHGGIIVLHRTRPPVSRPRTVSAVAGLSCDNYTPYQIGGA